MEMDIGETFTGMFREYEPLEVGFPLIGKVGAIVVGLVGSEFLLNQAKKYIEWFETAEVSTAKAVLGIALILIPSWLKFEGMIAGLLKAIGIGCLVGAGYTYIVDKWGEDIGISTLPFSGTHETKKEKESIKKALYL